MYYCVGAGGGNFVVKVENGEAPVDSAFDVENVYLTMTSAQGLGVIKLNDKDYPLKGKGKVTFENISYIYPLEEDTPFVRQLKLLDEQTRAKNSGILLS
jgi:hypothetical protein